MWGEDDAGCCPSQQVNTRYRPTAQGFTAEAIWFGDGPAPAEAAAPAPLEPVRTWARAFPQKLTGDGELHSLDTDLDIALLDTVPVPVGFEPFGWSTDDICYTAHYLFPAGHARMIEFYRAELPRSGMKVLGEEAIDGVTWLTTDQNLRVGITALGGASQVSLELCFYDY